MSEKQTKTRVPETPRWLKMLCDAAETLETGEELRVKRISEVGFVVEHLPAGDRDD